MVATIFVLWNEAEFLAVRNFLARGWIFPFLAITAVGFTGAAWTNPKTYLILSAMAFVAWHLVQFVTGKVKYSGEILAAIEAGRQKGFIDKTATPQKLAEDVFAAIGALLASELGACLISFYLDARNDPATFLLLYPVAICILSHTIWKGGATWWPKLVYGMAIVTAVIAVAMITRPQATRLVMEKWLPSDQCMAVRIRGEKLPIECQPRTPPPPRAAYRVGPTIRWQKVATLTAPAGGEWSKTYRSYDWPPYGYFRVVSFTECDAKEPVMAEVLFSDGKFFQLVPCRERDFGNKTGEFKLRSAGKRDVMVSLYKGVVE